MRTIRTLAICVAFGAALGTPAGATGEEVLDLVDNIEAQVLATADGLVVAPWQAVPNVPLPVSRTFKHNTDYVVITDRGNGLSVSKAGAFSNPNWWNCTTSNAAGAPVTVRCIAVPWQQSGIVWGCDVMDVSAHALTNHRHVHHWGETTGRETIASAQQTVNEIIGGSSARAAAPAVPNPERIHYGQAAGLLSCDGSVLETETANQANRFRTASGTFGVTGVTEFVCEARLAKNDPRSPITPYSVNCLDPGAPGVS